MKKIISMVYFVASWCPQPDVNSGLYENSLSQVLRATASTFLILCSAVYQGTGEQGRINPRWSLAPCQGNQMRTGVRIKMGSKSHGLDKSRLIQGSLKQRVPVTAQVGSTGGLGRIHQRLIYSLSSSVTR